MDPLAHWLHTRKHCATAVELDITLLRLATPDDPNESTLSYVTGMMASRLAIEGHVVYGAWDSTSEIQAYDLATESDLPSIALETYNGPVMGLAAADGRLFVVSPSDDRDGNLRQFDAATGQEVAPPQTVAGAGQAISCRTTPID